MKIISVKTIATCTLLVLFAVNSFSQTATNNNKVSSKKASKLDKSKVPKVVTDLYFNEYPVTTSESWYGYPSFDNGNWWYDYDPYFYTNDIGANYAVDFTQNNIPYTVIYSGSGKKIATHKKSISDLPAAVSTAISNSTYKSWKLGKDKEEIFKDKDSDQLKIYKVTVEKGKEKHALFFQSDGKLLKDKNCLKHSA